MFDTRPLQEPSDVWDYQRGVSRTSLKWLMLAIAALMLGVAVVELLNAPPGDSRAGAAAAMGVVAMLAYGAMVLGRGEVPRLPVVLCVLCVLMAGGWAMYIYGSVRTPVALSMVAAVVLAGTFLGRKPLILTTLAGLSILGVLTWAEALGHLNVPDFGVGIRYCSVGSAILLVLGGLLYHIRRETDEAHVRWLNQFEDRTRMEGERNRYLRRFGRIFRLNPTALMIQLASSQTVLDVNPAFERRFGVSREQMVGRKADALWADEEGWRSHLADLLLRGQQGWMQGQGLSQDGQRFDVLVNSALSESQTGAFILTTVVEPA